MRNQNDFYIIRELAKQYAEVACSEECRQIENKYRDLNSLKLVRPPVLIFEIPWGEFSDCDELTLTCENPKFRCLEDSLRKALYQRKHFWGDHTLHSYFRSQVAVNHSGIGLSVCEETIESLTGSSISSHAFKDNLSDWDSLEKLRLPEISLNKEQTENNYSFFSEIFDGIMPVKRSGVQLYFASWDVIPRLHGVENCLLDLYDRPDFAHAIIEKFTQIHEHELTEYERLNVLDTDPHYLHCTPACTHELPVKEVLKDDINAKDIWCRSMAQMFNMVSPEMHNEFDIQYTKRLFDRCGLSYYGCCEPLDTKIDQLRQLKNLRRISITPWANAQNAAEQMGSDYVMSYKPNPAYVAGSVLDKETVEKEISNVIESCLKNSTPFEFILKDISTVSRNPKILTEWLGTVQSVINRYF